MKKPPEGGFFVRLRACSAARCLRPGRPAARRCAPRSAGASRTACPRPPVMPMACSPCGNSPASRPPRRASALIIGCLRPMSWADPRSARNSRWRENQATTMAARKPSTMSSTMVVTSSRCRGPTAVVAAAQEAVDRVADHARQEHHEGVHHALDQRHRDHVAVGDVRHLVADHGLDLFARHALQQAGRHRDQRRVLEGAGGEGVGLALEDADLGHADAGLVGEPAHGRRRSSARRPIRGSSITRRPELHLAIGLLMSSEMIAPPKPMTSAKPSSAPRLSPLAVR